MATSSQLKEVIAASLDIPQVKTVAHFLLNSETTDSDSHKALFYNELLSITRLQISQQAVQFARSWRKSGWVKPGEVVVILSPSRVSFEHPYIRGNDLTP